MGFMFNGLKAQVTITGGISTNPVLPQANANQTVWVVSAATTTGSALHTPTGGKTSYITHISFYNNSNGGTDQQLIINDGSGGAVVYQNKIRSIQPTAGNGIDRISEDFSTPLPCATNVWVQTTNANDWITIVGFDA
jgi:hypothetical protein